MAAGDASNTCRGAVVAAHGRHYIVELDDGHTLRCYPRGKKSLIACGDRVLVQRTGTADGTVETIEPRKTLLYRADHFKQKLIAANVTQVAIVVACSPSFYDELVTRCLVAAGAQGLRAMIILNKIDLGSQTAIARERLRMYVDLGYIVTETSAHHDIESLRQRLMRECTVLVGQSGMGKSSLINALIPNAKATVGETSVALDSGRHTTTATYRYRMDEDSYLIDSPGMQEFGIAHLSPLQVATAFPEIEPLIGQCRFRDCLHLGEPGCAIAAAEQGFHPERMRIYRKLVTTLVNAPKHY